MAADLSPSDAPRRLRVAVASGDALDVRRFEVSERMSCLFQISLVVVSDNPDIDFEAIAGHPMTFSVSKGFEPRDVRVWTGLCSHLQQVQVEEGGLSTYHLTLSPVLWLATQQRNYRVFQQQSEIGIAKTILAEWGIEPVEKLSGTYKKRKYRVQYGESDYAFVCRMLEDAGISFYFEAEDDETTMVLHDAPQANVARPPIAFRSSPTDANREHVTQVCIGRRVRPGKYTMRDHDYRRPPRFKLMATAAAAQGVEERLERYHYAPGAFLFESDTGETTPSADDKGRFRTDEGEAEQLVRRRLAAKRTVAKTVSFATNALDLAPGVVLTVLDHPKTELAPGKPLLVLASRLSGTHDGKWAHQCEAVSADQPYRPPLDTPKPKAIGVESATVVGPPGEEIHTDEFGRVRVCFHWDRESNMDDSSSCWIHVSQPWGGTGFGATNLPRVGQEVIVDFLGGDPDRPIIVGRVYTNLQKTPYKLPDHKTQSGWKSASTKNTGGYNEIMFEDAAGRELVRMQAERDLHKLVKHDEQVRIGNDHAIQVDRDEAVTVGQNRAVQIGKDESQIIGASRTTVVGANDSAVVSMNRSHVVGMNEIVQIGETQRTNVGSKAEITVGAAKLTMDKSGKITLQGTELVFQSSGPVTINGTEISVKGSDTVIEASGQTEVHGGKVKITGKPIDLN